MSRQKRGKGVVQVASGMKAPKRQSFIDVKHACQEFIRDREEKGLMKPMRFPDFGDMSKVRKFR